MRTERRTPPREPDDFVDLRHPALADDLGIDEDRLERLRRQWPTLGPVIDRRRALDLLALLDVERHHEEDSHEQ